MILKPKFIGFSQNYPKKFLKFELIQVEKQGEAIIRENTVTPPFFSTVTLYYFPSLQRHDIVVAEMGVPLYHNAVSFPSL